MSKLRIYKTQNNDIDIVISIESANENSQFIISNSKDEHLKFLTDKNIEHLLIKSKNDEIIGFVLLVGLKNKNKSIEFRRIVIKDHGKGYGKLTIKEIKKYCFEKLHCHRLWLDVFEFNQRAIHIYKKLGFYKEGILRECIKTNQGYKSLVVMSLLKKEYNEKKEIKKH